MVESELVSRQMRALADMENSGVVPMLQQDKYADLGRMYALFRRVEGGLDLLRAVSEAAGAGAPRGPGSLPPRRGVCKLWVMHVPLLVTPLRLQRAPLPPHTPPTTTTAPPSPLNPLCSALRADDGRAPEGDGQGAGDGPGAAEGAGGVGAAAAAGAAGLHARAAALVLLAPSVFKLDAATCLLTRLGSTGGGSTQRGRQLAQGVAM